MKTLFLFILSIVLSYSAFAQRHEILSPEIKSLQVVVNDNWMEMPVMQLNGKHNITISFDDLTHEYRRFGYHIDHCEADWTISEGLFASDYIDGFSDNLVIDNYEESINTATLYNHYVLSIPNEDLRLKISGNYILTIFDDNASKDEPLLKVCFMVCDNQAGVTLNMTTNTDYEINNRLQQVEMTVNYNQLNVTNVDNQIKTAVMQNGRWTTARWNVRPQYITSTGLQWRHCSDYIFPASNEYRKFEYLDIHRNALGVDHTSFDGEEYHAWIYIDEPRLNYVHDVDANGAFVIKNSNNYENDTASEYVIFHFTYNTKEPLNGDVYVNGNWTNDRLDPQYLMTWNEDTNSYELAVKLKMGYYSYQYLLARPNGLVETSPYDGNYYQTENYYQAFVYYREPGGRCDKLVGYARYSSR